MKFYVWLNEQQQGPFDDETIQKMVLDGQITHETLLCPEGGDLDWTPAKELFPPDSSSESSAVAVIPSGESDSIEIKPWDFSAQQADDGTRLKIRLASGLELKIRAIRLYDEVTLAEINTKRAEVMKKFQGVSTGLGSIGSIGWVLASSVVIGAVEGILSAGAAASGANLLTDVIRMEQKLRAEGLFFAVGKIDNIETPVPGLWCVPYNQKKRIKTGVNFWSVEQFEVRDFPSAFINSGDEFLAVQTDDASVHLIRWGSVEYCILLKPS
jgi:hypothetical protein